MYKINLPFPVTFSPSEFCQGPVDDPNRLEEEGFFPLQHEDANGSSFPSGYTKNRFDRLCCGCANKLYTLLFYQMSSLV